MIVFNLFNRKPVEDTFTKLDRLMSEMATSNTYIEYLREREGMQWDCSMVLSLYFWYLGEYHQQHFYQINMKAEKMNYKYADKLSGYQLEPGDLIVFDGIDEPIQIKSLDILLDGYRVNYLDEYGDEELHQYIADDDIVDLYVYDMD